MFSVGSVFWKVEKASERRVTQAWRQRFSSTVKQSPEVGGMWSWTSWDLWEGE